MGRGGVLGQETWKPAGVIKKPRAMSPTETPFPPPRDSRAAHTPALWGSAQVLCACAEMFPHTPESHSPLCGNVPCRHASPRATYVQGSAWTI